MKSPWKNPWVVPNAWQTPVEILDGVGALQDGMQGDALAVQTGDDLAAALRATGMEAHDVFTHTLAACGPAGAASAWRALMEAGNLPFTWLMDTLADVAVTAPENARAMLGDALRLGRVAPNPRHGYRFEEAWIHGFKAGTDFPRVLRVTGCQELASLPDDLRVNGALTLKQCPSLVSLGDGIKVGGGLGIQDCVGLERIGAYLAVKKSMVVRGIPSLASIGEGLRVWGDLDLRGCVGLRHLPRQMHVGGELNLRGCTALEDLPASSDVRAQFLFLDGCSALSNLPDRLSIAVNLSARECTELKRLPMGLRVGNSLGLWKCSSLKALPSDLWVGFDLDLRGCDAWDGDIPSGVHVGSQILTDEYPQGIRLGAWRNERKGWVR